HGRGCSFSNPCQPKSLDINVQVDMISDVEEPLAREPLRELRLALEEFGHGGRRILHSPQMPERRHAMSERPIMRIGNSRCVPRPLLRSFEFAGKELRKRPVGVERPALRVMGAQTY